MITFSMDEIFFYSQGDEDNLFRSLENISFVRCVRGMGTSLIVDCQTSKVSADEFLTIYSIFKRYNADCKQISALIKFLSDDEIYYISNKEMLWHFDLF